MGLVLIVIGVCLVVSGMVLFTVRSEYEVSEDAFGRQVFCLVKRPVYFRSLYGILFDFG